MKKVLIVFVATVTMMSCTKDRVSSNSSGASSSSSGSSSNSGVEDKNATPPQAVLSSFVRNFGNVPVTQWKLRSDGTYRAHFMKNGVAWEATFKADGTLIKSEPA